MSDPAPLPRLGEVFFDVRGNSRSMRLSWYADTGVAVFSIWQAGMCTGTFRLPMADLSRMIGILERGPAPQGRGRSPVGGPRPDADRRGDPGDSDWYYGPDADAQDRPGAAGTPAGYGAEGTADYGRQGRGADYGRGGREPADYAAGGYGRPGQGDLSDADFNTGYESEGGFAPAGYGGADRADDPGYYGGDYRRGQPDRDEYPAQGYPAEYRRDELAEDGGYRAGYDQAGYEPGGYDQAGYEPGGYEPGGYDQAGYEPGGYGRSEADYGTGEYPGYPEQRGGHADRGYAETDDSGYHDERFAAPYVSDDGQVYRNDNPAPGGGYRGEIGDPAYPADRRRDSRSERYPEPPAAAEAYSYGADYRYR